MAQILKPHHTGIQVADLERSVAFYRDILGFELVFQWNPQAEYIRTIVGYPDADIHAAILRMPGSDVFDACEDRSTGRAGCAAGEALRELTDGEHAGRTALRGS